MGMSWTKEQEQVIWLQNRNILVSAAAGSGKTAVLVERILNKMLRRENPVDIDRLLIVTFTRAAAGEMRERLTVAIERRLEEEPDNEHLQRQQTLIHNAQITTIDGFCSYVIRNYFHTIDLDPGFRVADEGELKLLRYDVAKELLEREYGNPSENFENFIEVFAAGKKDDGIIERILELFRASMSNPWPKEWLRKCGDAYQIETVEALCESDWMEKMWMDVGYALEEARRQNSRFCEIVLESDGPYMYEAAASSDRQYIDDIENCVAKRDFDGCYALLNHYKYATLSRTKDVSVSDDKREMAKKMRDNCKDILKDLGKRYFYQQAKDILQELEVCRGPVGELIRLTGAFIDAFSEKKRKKNILDFGDIEHFALDILVKKQDEKLEYTQAADEFSRRFEEILIDEYQDSNFVQETLLQSVSKLRFGEHNIFMVGDVKQSIYKFRLARPELFMEKYETYSLEESDCQRIDLHKNFRSRAEVLSGANYIFEQIMGKNFGGIEYDAAAALYPGAVFPEADDINPSWYDTEVLVMRRDTPEMEDEDDLTGQELEARMVGERMKEIVGKEKVLDKETGTYRPVRFRDCVILLRSVAGWSETFVRVLTDMGIPAYSASKTGYFSTLEIRTLLNYLKLCDNPMQEIPFTGVLLSPIVGCTPEELGRIKASLPEEKIYKCVWHYREYGENDELCRKLDRFLTQYEIVRSRVPYTPIHELILFILKATGYGNIAAAMPGGAQRAANLEMLVEKAMEFEKTSYRGLFNFCRYMEQLQKYEVDFGEVNMLGENEDTVRVTTIHKSKGLEFPIVFVSGLGKQFNMKDANNPVVIHQDLGVGMYGVLPKMRVKQSTLLRKIIQKQIRLETQWEELRILYVALTRAKEKLILTGTVDKWEERLKKYELVRQSREKKIPYGQLESAKSLLDWVMLALMRHPVMGENGEDMSREDMSGEGAPFRFRLVSAANLVCKEIGEQLSRNELRQCLEKLNGGEVFDEKLRDSLREKFSYRYPLEYLQEIPAKVSVSELKLQDEEARPLITVEDIVPVEPEFIREEATVLKGAARGTAYHRVMELLDYNNLDSVETIQADIDRMLAEGKIDESMRDSVRASSIHWFSTSWIGKRMKRAASEGKLWREQQFIMSIPAGDMDTRWGDREQVLVQGIVDAFFEEEDGLVLVDYKTDHIQKGQEEELIEKYRKQLWYYAQVLERVRGKCVKEVHIYSFALGKSMPVKFEQLCL